MYYVCTSEGFLDIRNLHAGKGKTVWVQDIREASPFTTYKEADTAAKGRVQPNGEFHHFVILNTNHAPELVVESNHG